MNNKGRSLVPSKYRDKFFLGLLLVPVDSKVQGEVHHLLPRLQQKMLFVH